MTRLIMLALLLSGCTTHRIILSYDAPPAPAVDPQWAQQITQRVNDILGCLQLAQMQCIDAAEAARKGGQSHAGTP